MAPPGRPSVHLMAVRRRAGALLVALVAVVAAACGGSPGGPPPAVGGTATVTSVVDGDTLRAEVGGRAEGVRLLGIDTPESKKPGHPVECFAEAAAARTAALLPRGTVVRLVRDVEERDRFGRLLAYVVRQPDGLFVNLELARTGFATQLTIPPNVARAAELGAAVREARAAGRGLWGACPWARSPNVPP